MDNWDRLDDIMAYQLNIEENLVQPKDIEDVEAEYAKLYTEGMVPESDGPDMPSLTARMVVLGTIWAVFLGIMNGIFSFRTNYFFISSNAAAILSYPLGIFFASVLPRGILNPGPFTIKEHVLVYIIASSAGGRPYGVDNIVGQKFPRFMDDQSVTFWNSILFVITTQMIGYGLSGMTRRFLVRPAAIYWPTALSTVALFVAFHDTEESEESKKRALVGKSKLNHIQRSSTLGIYSSSGNGIQAVRLYDRTTFELNTTAYDLVKPIYLTEMFAVQYAISFFSLTCSLTHVALWYHKDIIRQTKEMIMREKDKTPDIHNQLMRAYPDIPEWMYLGWLAIWLVVMVFVGIFTPFRLPWWGTIFGLVLAFVFLIPYGIIQGSSGQQLGLNIITELLMGLIIPGQTVAVMTFKSYSYNIMIQALSLTYDLKVGHYLHINPVHMVISQLWGTIIGAVCNTAAVWIAIAYFPLDSEDWMYPAHTTFFNAGAIWGAIGPARFFGPSSPYFSLNLGYLFGLILPVLPWLANRFMPHPYWRFIHFPIMSGVASTGGIQSYLVSGVIIAFIFMYYMFTYKHAWWTKYNYVLGSALDAGSSVSILIATIVAMRVTIPLSAINPPMYDYYCTGTNWNDPQFG
ncbi:hypothetical protein BASA50_006021 [Batrachochytrium salamandrivorans]|uniref:OPT family small oligopeptide transporter n=1 Tax=Batrachochytrium salamandrivorans TaxID=1357716 RepID=A0ABQ8FEF5_9FUNG|nr:hypothetical protein BASA50_006021 [Batrachochytrium salamandrivorans]